MTLVQPGDALTSPMSSLQRPLKIREVAAYVEQRSGHRPSIESVYRWTRVGCNGHRLDTVRVGALRLVYPAAVDRFLASLQD